MPKRSKKHKLTPKEEAVISDVIRSVNEGESFSPAKSVERIYDVRKSSAATIASKKMRDDDFRNALMRALEERRIIGADSKVEQVLAEGLDATSGEDPDFKVRLDYAKEINKIAGVYAPEKKETKSLHLNLNMTEEEMEEKIKELQEQLQ